MDIGTSEDLSRDDEGVECDEMTRLTVTDDDFDAWRGRLSEINSQMDILAEEKASIEAALSVRSILESLKTGRPQAVAPLPAAAEHPPSGSDMTIADAIVAVLKASDRSMTPAEIKRQMSSVGFRQNFGSNYFYTVIGKCVDKQLLAKRGGKYRYIGARSNGLAAG